MNRRQRRELNVILKAKDLLRYTWEITNNSRNFPKKVRFTMTNRIQDKVISLYENLLRANEYDLRIQDEKMLRLKMQKDALILCKELLFFVELSLESGYISTKSCKFWTKAILDVKYMTAAWVKKDKAR